MNRIVLLLISICFMIQSYGQEQKEFIEIIVEDSIHVEPEEIFYMVMLSAPYTSDTVYIENTPGAVISHSSADRLKKLISQMQIDTMGVTELNILNRYAASDKTMLLHFYSKSKLEAFVREAKKIEDLTGSIISMKHSKLDMYNKQLTKKLLTRAKTDAIFLSEQSGKKLGGLLQIREEMDESLGGWTMYPPLSGLMQANIPGTIDKIILTKKFIVRYAW